MTDHGSKPNPGTRVVLLGPAPITHSYVGCLLERREKQGCFPPRSAPPVSTAEGYGSGGPSSAHTWERGDQCQSQCKYCVWEGTSIPQPFRLQATGQRGGRAEKCPCLTLGQEVRSRVPKAAPGRDRVPYLLQMLQWWVRAGLGAMHFLQMDTPVRSFLACAHVRRDLCTLNLHLTFLLSPVPTYCLPTLHCPA